MLGKQVGLDISIIDTPGRTGALDAEGEAVALQRYVERNVCLNHSPTQLFPKLNPPFSSPTQLLQPPPPSLLSSSKTCNYAYLCNTKKSSRTSYSLLFLLAGDLRRIA